MLSQLIALGYLTRVETCTQLRYCFPQRRYYDWRITALTRAYVNSGCSNPGWGLQPGQEASFYPRIFSIIRSTPRVTTGKLCFSPIEMVGAGLLVSCRGLRKSHFRKCVPQLLQLDRRVTFFFFTGLNWSSTRIPGDFYV